MKGKQFLIWQPNNDAINKAFPVKEICYSLCTLFHNFNHIFSIRCALFWVGRKQARIGGSKGKKAASTLSTLKKALSMLYLSYKDVNPISAPPHISYLLT